MPSEKLRKAGVSTEKFDRCVSKVAAKSGEKVNAFAVCESSLQKARGLRPKRRSHRRRVSGRR